MKPRRYHRQNRSNGYTLIAAAITAGILGILVVGYLVWVTNEYRLSQRSHRWSQALYLAEAGVDLGMAELNFKYRPAPGSAFSTADGWTSPSSGTFRKTVSNFTDAAGQVLGSFVVAVSGISLQNPTITCTGTALNPSSGPTVSRTVRAMVRRNGAFSYALLAREQIEISASSGTIAVDSFDSSDSTMSTSGQYDATKRQANGNITSASTAADAIALKGVDVYGTVDTGVGGGVSFQGATTVGATTNSAQRSSTQADAEAAGWVTHDFNSMISSAFLPPELKTAPSLGTLKTTTTISTGDWRADQISANSDLITITGNVRLYVAGNVNFSGTASLVVTPGSKLEIYIAGDVAVSGGGAINQAGLAENNAWYGLDSSTSWSIGGNGGFVGTMYAPNADLKLNGCPSYTGALVGKTITTVGNPGIHYDEALRQVGGNYIFTVIAWEPIVNRGGTWDLETN